MSREKSIFEQMGGTYTEKDGILYPNIHIGEEETEAMQNTFSGKLEPLCAAWSNSLETSSNFFPNFETVVSSMQRNTG